MLLVLTRGELHRVFSITFNAGELLMIGAVVVWGFARNGLGRAISLNGHWGRTCHCRSASGQPAEDAGGGRQGGVILAQHWPAARFFATRSSGTPHPAAAPLRKAPFMAQTTSSCPSASRWNGQFTRT